MNQQRYESGVRLDITIWQLMSCLIQMYLQTQGQICMIFETGQEVYIEELELELLNLELNNCLQSG